MRFVVIGYTDRVHEAWQSDDARLTVHGRYDPTDLPELLEHYDARLVLFPSMGPETFAFTLSEVWAAGRPVLVPPIGALAERVGDHGAGWVLDEASGVTSPACSIASCRSWRRRMPRHSPTQVATAGPCRSPRWKRWFGPRWRCTGP